MAFAFIFLTNINETSKKISGPCFGFASLVCAARIRSPNRFSISCHHFLSGRERDEEQHVD
jgi:hypothetical protein